MFQLPSYIFSGVYRSGESSAPEQTAATIIKNSGTYRMLFFILRRCLWHGLLFIGGRSFQLYGAADSAAQSTDAMAQIAEGIAICGGVRQDGASLAHR